MRFISCLLQLSCWPVRESFSVFSQLRFCSAACRYQGGPGAVPVLHLQYRGIERLQNLKVCVLPALGSPLAP